MIACPRPEDLLDALDTPGEALAAHVQGCPACAEQLRLLHQAFDAMGPASGAIAVVPVDEATMGRIAQAVAAGTAPRRLWLRAVLAVLGVLVALGGWCLLRGHPLTSPPGLALAAVPLLIVPLVRAAPRWQAMGLLVVLLGVGAMVLTGPADDWVPFLRGAGCLALLLTGAAGPALALWGAVRAEGGGALRGALFGLAIFSGGTALQRTLCDLGGTWHVLGFHLAPLLLGVSALALLARVTTSRALS